ncbi:MAG: SDR family NAD(P)-dependent oxidoreductase [Cellvibrionaceae bacterium]
MNIKEKKPLVVIAGLGKGLGLELAVFFVNKGYRVIGLNRNTIGADENTIIEYIVDLNDEVAVNKVASLIFSKYGIPEVLIHNTQQLVIAEFEKTSAIQFEACWRSIVLSAFLFSQTFLPEMAKRGCGSLIVSGATASIRGGANFSAFSSAKFALRGLTQSLARSYQQKGIHVAHVLLDGIINTDNSRELHQMSSDKMMQPNDIANVYWQIINQTKSVWTHELDLRPATENF